MHQKFEDYIKQIKSYWSILHIGSKLKYRSFSLSTDTFKINERTWLMDIRKISCHGKETINSK